MEKQDSLTLRESSEHFEGGSQACQSGIMDFVENSNLSTLSEEVSCVPTPEFNKVSFNQTLGSLRKSPTSREAFLLVGDKRRQPSVWLNESSISISAPLRSKTMMDGAKVLASPVAAKKTKSSSNDISLLKVKWSKDETEAIKCFLQGKRKIQEFLEKHKMYSLEGLDERTEIIED
uniref:Uncharacterized protein n=1 Tax=Magallana gigas TaxID=29159 RepID=K1PFF1_MAGGI